MSLISQTKSAGERVLGTYLFGLCLYQIGIYCWPGGPPFVLDPRAGIPVLLINHFNFDNKAIYPVEWITATWLLVAAVSIFFRGKLVKAYLAAEIALATPTAYYIVVLAIQRGGHFAPARLDLAVTIFLFGIFSLLPIALAAWRLWRRANAEGSAADALTFPRH